MVQEVEDVVDASFVEELERASITRTLEGQGPGARGRGRGRDARGGRGRGSRDEGCGQDGEAEVRTHSKGVETEEDWARYRECMRPLQVRCAWGRVMLCCHCYDIVVAVAVVAAAALKKCYR